jgi:transposase
MAASTKIVVDKLSEFDKGKLTQSIDMGMSLNDMTTEIDRYKTSIGRWKQIYLETGSMDRRVGSGRKRKTTE